MIANGAASKYTKVFFSRDPARKPRDWDIKSRESHRKIKYAIARQLKYSSVPSDTDAATIYKSGTAQTQPDAISTAESLPNKQAGFETKHDSSRAYP